MNILVFPVYFHENKSSGSKNKIRDTIKVLNLKNSKKEYKLIWIFTYITIITNLNTPVRKDEMIHLKKKYT